MRFAVSLCMSLLLVGCDVASTSDGGDGGARGGDELCRSDLDCRDGVFCNGNELCDPLSSAADEQGCRGGVPPCRGSSCDEESLSCGDECADADGDGHGSVFCGGDDCDDTDPDRYPGNLERCDDVDQDCDEATVGDRDEDRDGSIAQACCNGERCGLDCDDQVANISRLAPEVCDGVDNDCDGVIDDGVLLPAYPDLDFDQFGDASAEPIFLCQVPFGLVSRGGDCDDTDDSVNPSLPDVCDGKDSDCDGEVDDGADEICAAADSAALCVTEADGSGGACRSLTCESGFSDCDGSPANGCETNLCVSVTSCGACSQSCGEFACSSGRCNTGPPLPPAQAAVTVSSSQGDLLAGAEVEVVGGCPVQSSWTTNDSGTATLSTVGQIAGARAERTGYLPGASTQLANLILFTSAEVEDWEAELGVPVVGARHGAIVIDINAGVDPALVLTGSSGAAAELSGLLNGGTTRRLIVPQVAPGTTRVLLDSQELGCSLVGCSSTPEIEVYVEAGSISYFRFSACAKACLG